ncbi:dienelactone hydrolase family protein [Maribellus sp. YY47]|uniref:dienelactone hydrolase family protein n=1 Tax=Maribellus sp. YY47 TaxID=2929486 RepID=UPI0020010817|nr:dienelactone hydrolase family protein [Maribellus sp. YY47]MCK3683580.1 dienelactone hydrolase family protein [Maribellus sp. YY47]
MLKKLILFSFVLALISSCENQDKKDVKMLETLNTYLQSSPEKVSELTGEISAEAATKAEQEIHAYLENKIKAAYQADWDSLKLVVNHKELKFKYRKFGEKPPQGWSLYISMHGGGNAAPEVNDQQWKNQINLYRPKEGIYLAPRAPTNTWNLWHEPHIDSMFTQLIEIADAFEDINTNRVYLTGYSAGGDGTYQLAPRMADQLAAAAMMAGHPNDASPLGLRNLPFTIHMGGDDGAYNRNKIAAEWKNKLDSLQKQDPEGYIHDVQIHEGKGHWMDRQDTVAIEWMAQFTRNPYPKKVVWKQSGVTHNRFYWLVVPSGSAKKDAEVIATLDDQTITIEEAELIDTLSIRLNGDMLKLDQKVRVFYNGQLLYDAVPTRNVATIWKSLSERNDPEQVFSAQIEVNLK